jgi:hypothetical protein
MQDLVYDLPWPDNFVSQQKNVFLKKIIKWNFQRN